MNLRLMAAAAGAALWMPSALPQAAPGVSAPQATGVPAAQAVPSAAGVIRGVVHAGRTPLPGAVVTATHTLTGRQYVTVTDANGHYSLPVAEGGRYVLRAELAAFAPASAEVLIHGSAEVAADLALILASRRPSTEQAPLQQTAPAGPRPRFEGGMQGLASALAGTGAADVTLPSAAMNGDFSTDSVAVNGESGSTNPLAGINMQQLRERMDDMRQQEGLSQVPGQRGPAPGAGGWMGGMGGGMGGRSMNFRHFNPSRPHGALFWQGGNSALDAKDFALRGQPVEQPSYSSNKYGVVFAGAPFVPRLLEHDTKDFLFLMVTGSQSSSPFDSYGSVPDLPEREGNFSGQPTIYDPATGLPFAGNVIPPNRISPQATALLRYVPLPNLPTANSQNYQRLTSAESNMTTVGARYMRSFGEGTALTSMLRQLTGAGAPGLHQSIHVNFNYSHTGADELNLFPLLGGKQQMHEYSVEAGYTLACGQATHALTAVLNRSNTQLRNQFTSSRDIAGEIGIQVLQGEAVNPLNYGLPNVTLVQFSSLAEQQPNFQVNQTLGVSDASSWLRGRHNVRFGGDYKRIDLNMLGEADSTGTFVFTGLATEQPGAAPAGRNNGQPSSGSSLADLLLGLPQQTAIQAPYRKAYLRANVYDAYLQDDWRIAANLSLLAGIRYEYFSPYSEKDGRLATIDPSADFSRVAPVLAGHAGPYGGFYPKTLLYPDRDNFSPRVGFAWRPLRGTVVRGGYGINFTNGQYASFIQNLAFQPPFADVQTNQATAPTAGVPACTAYWQLCLAHGFGPSQPDGNYSVNKNYRLSYVQVWNLDVQRTLPGAIVLNVGYNGAKGTRLDVLTAPGRTATASLSGVYYNYSDSIGFSSFHAGTVRLRRRLHDGIALGATYTYSHSIDDASAVGGQGGTTAVVAQNWRNILGEESNSSFDVRHNLKGDFVYELPFGPDARLLAGGGWISHGLANLSVSGTFALATGEPLTPRFIANSADVARGSTGSLRPNRARGASLMEGGGHLNRWFNTAAFSSDFAPGQVYGTASRYSIPGPGTVTFDLSLSKTVRLGEARNLELRGVADNVLNTVQYAGVDTNLGSNTYGQVTSAAQMRTFVLMARFRY